MKGSGFIRVNLPKEIARTQSLALWDSEPERIERLEKEREDLLCFWGRPKEKVCPLSPLQNYDSFVLSS